MQQPESELCPLLRWRTVLRSGPHPDLDEKLAQLNLTRHAPRGPSKSELRRISRLWCQDEEKHDTTVGLCRERRDGDGDGDRDGALLPVALDGRGPPPLRRRRLPRGH